MGNTYTPGGTPGQFMAPGVAQDRLVRKEVALGQIREIEPPQDHIGINAIAPFLPVATDEVIFDYVRGLTDGLAPARAEDAESELAQKDDLALGQGRASVIDWAEKTHYTASDVARYREYSRLAELAEGGAFPLTVTSQTEDFASKIARDDARRRRKLDNRLEWLITQGLSAGSIVYNDGKIKFNVDYGRPVGQSGVAPVSGTYATDAHDPIGDIIAVNELMNDAYGVEMGRMIISKKALYRMASAAKFGLKAGFVPNGSGGTVSADPHYLIDGYGPQYAIDLIKGQTGIDIITYDSVYRTRPIGSATVTNNRFMPENRVIFLPNEADLDEFDDTQIGFAKTLTSPHPEGNWASGYYEWEKDDVDPWGTDRGAGIKAFPVFLHLDKTLTWDLTLS